MFIHEYTVEVEREIETAKVQIVDMILNFQSTNWTDKKSMIDAAGDIMILKERVNDVINTHKFILDNYRAVE